MAQPPLLPGVFCGGNMASLTLKQLVNKYNAPRSIVMRWWRVPGDCNRSGAREVAEVYYWLAYLVYTTLSKYAHPHHFVLKAEANSVKLMYCNYGKCYTLARFSLYFSCRHAYHSQDFRPLLCVLSYLQQHSGNISFHAIVKKCVNTK